MDNRLLFDNVFTKSVYPVFLNPDINFLSIDLEHWCDIKCIDGALYLLELLKKRKAKATFFVLGPVAQEYPDLIRQINQDGHEIGCHGWKHVPVFNMTKPEFEDDIKRSVNVLTDIINKPIIGFRAPYFSISKRNLWALDVLAQNGFLYDSSIFPIAGSRYGIPDFPRKQCRIRFKNSSIIEVPLSTVRFKQINYPVSGGGYFRLLPYPFIKRATTSINNENIPFVVYCHPYEFHHQSLKYPLDDTSCGWFARKKTTVKANLFRSTMKPKLSRLLDTFQFSSYQEILAKEFY
jgi:polysaccharide deacetylase family protein (PEP-CTERM system associated)